jgi:hypothetical protein
VPVLFVFIPNFSSTENIADLLINSGVFPSNNSDKDIPRFSLGLQQDIEILL